MCAVCLCVPAMDVPVCDVMRLGQNVLVTCDVCVAVWYSGEMNE